MKKTNRKNTATAMSDRRVHRIKGLLIGLEQMIDQIAPEGEDKDWGTAGSLEHVESELAQLIMGFEIGTDEREGDCIDRILANVDPKGEGYLV